MAVNARTNRPRTRTRSTSTPGLERLRHWPPEAWWATGVTALFLTLGCWWVVRDHSVPISDAGFHLTVTIEVFQEIQTGDWAKALGPHIQYPPLVYLVGSLGNAIGGLDVTSMVIAENLFFVPLLALGCYGIGRLAFDPATGLLAVIFALGSPLVARLFHLTMLDAPQAAMVAVSIWLILATRYFTRLWVCALAGLAVGLALLTKESAALFLVGVLIVTFIRGGWRSWRGLLVFALVVLVIAAPWYLNDLTQVRSIGSGVATAGTAAHNPLAPPRLSSENLEWYVWSFVTSEVYLPLFLFSVVGGIWALVGFIRRRWISPLAPELLVGACTAWLGLTETFVHDIRYGMSMLVYLAVFGSFWIVRLPRPGRIAATTALVLLAIVNTLGSNFGLLGTADLTLPHALQRAKALGNTATIVSNSGYLVSAAPERESNMLGTLRELKRVGVEGILILPSETINSTAFLEGVVPLTMIVNLKWGEAKPPPNLPNTVAVFDREQLSKNRVPPCVKLPDGTGVWIRLGNPYAPGAQDYCPSRHPQFYSE